MKKRELSDEENEQLAKSAREALGIDEQLRPNLIDILDSAKRIRMIVDYITVPDEIMGTVRGRFDPNAGILYLSESTRAGAEANVPHDCFTIAHELAHRLLKHERPRNRNSVKTVAEKLSPTIRAEDRAAERLAAAFLAPYHRSDFNVETTAQQIEARFNLSFEAARIRREEFARMFRRAHDLEREVPPGVIDFQNELRKRGRSAPNAFSQLAKSKAASLASSEDRRRNLSSAEPAPTYDDRPCPHCTRRTLMLIGVKYVCNSADCGFVGDFPDGD